jgi:flagellar basal-body rod modification protein FlgD
MLEKLGVKSSESSKTEDSKKQQTLGQQDFLRLMTEQMSQQDPFKPMENGDFIAQMAQFSTVTGLGEIKETLDGLSKQLSGNRVSTLVDFLGTKVLAPGGRSPIDSNGVVEGVLDLPQPASSVTITVSNEAGSSIDTMQLGALSKGLNGFTWSPSERNISVTPNEKFLFQAFVGDTDGASEAVTTSLYKKVLGGHIENGQEMLKLSDNSEIKAANVLALKL